MNEQIKSIQTADGEQLDALAKFVGLTRHDSETDASLRDRTLAMYSLPDECERNFGETDAEYQLRIKEGGAA